MNFGSILLDISKALLNFGSEAIAFLTNKIDISKFINTLKILNININLPQELSVIGLIGTISGISILTFFLIKLIRG